MLGMLDDVLVVVVSVIGGEYERTGQTKIDWRKGRR
jgi:hypothetical protein